MTRRFLSRMISLVALTAIPVLGTPSLAQAETPAESPPGKFVTDQQAKLREHTEKKETAKLDQKFDQILDYGSIARASLDEQWGKLSQPEQKQFQCVLRVLVVKSYRRNLDKTLKYQVTIDGIDAAGEGQLVKTTASKDDGRDPVSVAYLLVPQGKGEFVIRDIVTEGSSLVSNYRSQFKKLIKDKGFDELMRRMQKKAGDEASHCAALPKDDAAGKPPAPDGAKPAKPK